MSASRADGRFTCAHFAKTESALRAELPDVLVHRAVVAATVDTGFSAERKHPVWVVDLPSRAISVTIGALAPGQRTNRHRHSYETILYVLEGEGISRIEDREVEWRAGDAVYVPVWAWHEHVNRSSVHSCRYVACENAPMLQNLGAAVREESTEESR